jgi:hypothetical protein
MLAPWFPTSDEDLSPIFTAYLSEHSRFSDDFRHFRQSAFWFVGSFREVRPSSSK